MPGPDKPSWWWDSPRPPEHSVIFAPHGADDRRAAVVPTVHLLEDGRLACDFSHDLMLSDAVQADRTRPVYVSSDGGATWERHDGVPPGLVLEPMAGQNLLQPKRMHDGSLLMRCNYGW